MRRKRFNKRKVYYKAIRRMIGVTFLLSLSVYTASYFTSSTFSLLGDQEAKKMTVTADVYFPSVTDEVYGPQDDERSPATVADDVYGKGTGS